MQLRDGLTALVYWKWLEAQFVSCSSLSNTNSSVIYVGGADDV